MMAPLPVGCAAILGAIAGCFAPMVSDAVAISMIVEGTGFDEPEPLARSLSALVGLVVAALFAATVADFGWTAKGVLLCGFLFVLVVLSIIDFRTFLLPDRLTLPLAIAGCVVNAFSAIVPMNDAIIGALSAALCFWLLHCLIFRVTGREGLGFGDVKLYWAIGVWLGWQPLLHVFALALLLAAIYGLGLFTMRKVGEDRLIPFGPFLAAGAAITALFGSPLYAVAIGS
ncbi:prepilin peptidase [Paraburkholderia fungorum]|uniref:prepilin peptidase n=1 Tax=Paraburkholderia fungorum TaxID=134537 RepID=UPI00402B1116